ncbi:hypothetical protein B484DRAFT_467639 [Ochromonadaceae sp. CCMP2298]|nr:hypothetical protein B484DRAFT_467639 [Ochromonadaceae sp. CCMP2298]
MTTPTIIIPKFVGGQGSTLEWPGWLEQLQMIALSTPTSHPSGLHLLGPLLPAAMWQIHPLVIAKNLEGQPFQRLQHPGAVQRDLADAVLLVPVATYYNRYKVNDIETGMWEKENNEVLAFRTALIAALDESLHHLLADPGGGTAVFNLMLDEMIERLHQQYGNIAPSLVSAVAHQLDDPYQPGTDMLAFLARHTKLQRILAQAGEQLQDGAKIRHIPARMTWEGYCDAMVAAALRHNTFGTTGTAGFGAAATTETDLRAHMRGHAPPPLTALQAEHLHFGHTPTPIPGTLTVAAIVAAVRAKLGKGPAANPPNVSEKPIRQYCWTHGLCAHNGKDCKGPKHTTAQQRATHTNNMGGSTKGCGEAPSA